MRCNRGIFHLCPLIAERLHDFKNVRLRMRCICSQVLDTSSATLNVESRLKTLVIKLSLPCYPEAHNNFTEFDAKSCIATAIPLYKKMLAAGTELAKKSPGLSMMRISDRGESDGHLFSSRCVAVADCVSKRYHSGTHTRSCYDDDGSWWTS